MAHKTKSKKLSSNAKKQPNIWLIGGIVLGLLIVIGALPLLRGSGTESTIVGFPEIEFSNEAGAQLGQIAPDFTVPVLENDSFTLVSQNRKPTIIFFMAYWCGSCIPEAIALAEIQKEYGDGVTIIALDIDSSSSPERLSSFREASGNPSYFWGFDVGQQVATNYEVQALDTTLILDSEGHVVYRDAFPSSYGQLNEILEQLGL